MNDIKRSLSIIRENTAIDIGKAVGSELAPAIGAGLATKAIAKKVGGQGAKVIPGVGTALSWKDAYDRWKRGDRSGAVLAGLAGAAYAVPGLGILPGTALDAVNIGRDIKRGHYDALGNWVKQKFTGSQETPTTQEPTTQEPTTQEPTTQEPTTTTQVPPNGDPNIFALQQQLIAKGARNLDGTPLTADGRMGKNTRAAMQKYGIGQEIKENYMSLVDQIKFFRDKLDEITPPASVITPVLANAADALPTVLRKGGKTWDLELASGVYKVRGGTETMPIDKMAKQLAKADGKLSPGGVGGKDTAAGKRAQKAMNDMVKGGIQSRSGVTTTANQTASTAASQTANTTANQTGANAGTTASAGKELTKAQKAALGVGAVGAAGVAGYMLGGDTGQDPNPAPTPGPGPKPPGPGPGPKPPGPGKFSELDELDALAREISRFNDPLANELMGQYNALRPKLGPAKAAPNAVDELTEMLRILNR